jgi:hypothetical protein
VPISPLSGVFIDPRRLVVPSTLVHCFKPHSPSRFIITLSAFDLSTALPLIHLIFCSSNTLPSSTNLQHRTNTHHTLHHHYTTLITKSGTTNTPIKNVATVAVENNQVVRADSLSASTTADTYDMPLASGDSEDQLVSGANDSAHLEQENDENGQDDVCNTLRWSVVLGLHAILEVEFEYSLRSVRKIAPVYARFDDAGAEPPDEAHLHPPLPSPCIFG